MPTSEDIKAFETEWEGVPYKPLFNCPQCKGAGFVHPRKPDGSVDYKRAIPCDYPGCYSENFNAYLKGEIVQQSGVIGFKQTFETFDKNVSGVAKAFSMAKKIAEGESDFIWGIIYGGVGNGKTHLLNAIANQVMGRGISVKLIMMAELLSELRMAIEDKQVDFKMKVLKEVPYLLIDELGLEYGTDWEREKIEELFAARWNNGRFTVVATNLSIEDLPERIKSRFKDQHLSRWVKNSAGDYRLTRGKK
jgi:DNA replication protein DnaC